MGEEGKEGEKRKVSASQNLPGKQFMNERLTWLPASSTPPNPRLVQGGRGRRK